MISPDSRTALHFHDDKQIILKEDDASSRAVFNTFVAIVGFVMLLGAAYLLRMYLSAPTTISPRAGLGGLAGIGMGIFLIMVGNFRFERSQFVMTTDAITVHYRNNFKRVVRRYRTENITGLFLEVSGTVPQGGVLFSSGLALVFCYGSIEKVQEVLDKAAALWQIPSSTYMLINAPLRDQIVQGLSHGIEFADNGELLRNAERLSRQELQTSKKSAPLGTYDDLPRPGAREDGAFQLAAYMHSFWNLDDKTVCFLSPDTTSQTVGFDKIVEIAVHPSLEKQKMQVPNQNLFVFLYSAVLTARLSSGETKTLTTVVHVEMVVPGDSKKRLAKNLAEPRARRLAARLAEWSKVAVS